MSNLTSEEFKQKIKLKPIVILPLGAYEQHGPAGYIGADWVISEYIARLIAKKVDVICLPGLPFGYSKIHDSFSGTITIDKEIYYQLIKCIVLKLKIHGVKGVVLFNGHGGNLIPLRELIKDEGMSVYFMEWFKICGNRFFSDEHKSHAGSEELSVLAAINPNLVTDSLVADMIPAPHGRQIDNVWEKMEYITLNGVHLLANQYDKRKGHEVILYVVEKASKIVLEYIEQIKN